MPASLPTPGTSVWIRQQRWRVERSRRDRGVVRLDVANHQQRITFLTPFDRLDVVAARRRLRCVRPQRARAKATALVADTYNLRTLRALIHARASILPHQVEPLLAVLNGARRVLIADEVGLGKTVQAGLVMAELERRRGSLRALVIVPVTLRTQWADELSGRFGLHTRVADAHALDGAVRAGRRGDNPWNQPDIWLVSVDYLKQPHVLDAIPLQPWDVVVIDEVHDICGESDRHAACTRMASRSRCVLLLTATPHSGDPLRFSRLERLGELPSTRDELIVFRRTRRDVALTGPRRVRWQRIALSTAERRVLDSLAAFEAAALAAAGTARRDAVLLLLSVFRKRALSTMAALDISLARRLNVLSGEPDAAADAFQPQLSGFDTRDDLDDDERAGLTVESGLGVARERAWLGRLRILTRAALARESKVEWLARLVHRAREPLVVFTEFRDSLAAIERRLANHRHVAVLYGAQTPEERRRALDEFLGGRASVLVATDVAGQGLNLQRRARWVATVELPWNPARLEQRLGRVDRIGQTLPVHLTVLVARHEAESGLLCRLAARTLLARQSLGDDILGDVTPPPAHLIAARLMTGAADEPPPAASAPIVTCSRWRRPARVLSAHAVRLRTLGAAWRGATEQPSRPCGSSLRTLPRLAALYPGTIVLLSVPVVDSTGNIVERHLVVIGVPLQVSGTVNELARSVSVAAAARSVVQPRLRRASRIVAGYTQERARFERAIVEYAQATGSTDPVEPGLFDRRALGAFEARRREIDALRQETAIRLREYQAHSILDIGQPVVELVLGAPG